MTMRSRADGVLRWFRASGVGTLFYLDANEEEVALPIGTEGQALTVASGLPAWGSGASGVILVDSDSGEILIDGDSGEVLYDG